MSLYKIRSILGLTCEASLLSKDLNFILSRLMSENNFLIYFVQVLSFLVGGLIHFFQSISSTSSFQFLCLTGFLFLLLMIPFIFGSQLICWMSVITNTISVNIQAMLLHFLVAYSVACWIKIQIFFSIKSEIKGSVQVCFPGQPSYSSLSPSSPWLRTEGELFVLFFFSPLI